MRTFLYLTALFVGFPFLLMGQSSKIYHQIALRKVLMEIQTLYNGEIETMVYVRQGRKKLKFEGIKWKSSSFVSRTLVIDQEDTVSVKFWKFRKEQLLDSVRGHFYMRYYMGPLGSPRSSKVDVKNLDDLVLTTERIERIIFDHWQKEWPPLGRSVNINFDEVEVFIEGQGWLKLKQVDGVPSLSIVYKENEKRGGD
ncbi:MAG: hypothetical protein MRZ79_15795 [Bacteroidia bacterium]|nr:hypothetical protein [Bacteroidia bacterium]